MDFALDDEQTALQALARDVLTAHASHQALTALEAQGVAVFDRALWARLAAAGLTGVALPEGCGGAGRGFLDLAVLCEEVGRTVAPVPAVPTLVTAYVLARQGLGGDLLPGVADGSVLLAAAFEGEVAARRDGSGWVLDGEARFVPYGAEADVVVVAAVADTGPAAALLRRDGEGVAVTELATTSRQPQAHLAFTAAPVPTVVADAAGLLRDLRLHTTAALCSVQAGVCDAALRMTARYAGEREQFGKPIGSFQAVGQRAADAYVDAEIVRLTAQQAGWRLASGQPAAEEVAVAKFWAGDGGSRVLHACQHLHGGIGVDLDYPLHRYFLWTKQLEHTLGTPVRQLLTLGAALAATGV